MAGGHGAGVNETALFFYFIIAESGPGQGPGYHGHVGAGARRGAVDSFAGQVFKAFYFGVCQDHPGDLQSHRDLPEPSFVFCVRLFKGFFAKPARVAEAGQPNSQVRFIGQNAFHGGFGATGDGADIYFRVGFSNAPQKRLGHRVPGGALAEIHL